LKSPVGVTVKNRF